jgi:hypothetical protein
MSNISVWGAVAVESTLEVAIHGKKRPTSIYDNNAIRKNTTNYPGRDE